MFNAHSRQNCKFRVHKSNSASGAPFRASHVTSTANMVIGCVLSPFKPVKCIAKRSLEPGPLYSMQNALEIMNKFRTIRLQTLFTNSDFYEVFIDHIDTDLQASIAVSIYRLLIQVFFCVHSSEATHLNPTTCAIHYRHQPLKHTPHSFLLTSHVPSMN